MTKPKIPEHLSRPHVVEQLSAVVDPELGINIVDMGLIYTIDIFDEQKRVLIGMSLSSKGCPMGRAIVGAAESMLKNSFEGYAIEIDLTWEPAWSPEFISEEGRSYLNNA